MNDQIKFMKLNYPLKFLQVYTMYSRLPRNSTNSVKAKTEISQYSQRLK